MGPLFALALGSAAIGGALSITKGFEQQKIAEENAATETLNAQYAKISAADRAFRIRYVSRLTLGQMSTSYARGGVKVGSGSSGDVLAETANQYDLDALKAEIQGNVAESAYLRSAHLLRKSGQRAVTAGFLSAGSQLAMAGINIAGAGGFSSGMPSALETTGSDAYGNYFINLPPGVK
jgi:hypothetical protein